MRLRDALEVAKVAEGKAAEARWRLCGMRAAPLSRARVPGFRRCLTGGNTRATTAHFGTVSPPAKAAKVAKVCRANYFLEKGLLEVIAG
jgi:hypothetical protein